jgi:ferric-dicitrate binding protein FerR (iron transport regulator)
MFDQNPYDPGQLNGQPADDVQQPWGQIEEQQAWGQVEGQHEADVHEAERGLAETGAVVGGYALWQRWQQRQAPGQRPVPARRSRAGLVVLLVVVAVVALMVIFG